MTLPLATKAQTREALGDELYRSVLATQRLKAYLDAHPITDDDKRDLNPHLQILFIAGEIANAVNSESECEGIGCTKEEVILLWLTWLVCHGGLPT